MHFINLCVLFNTYMDKFEFEIDNEIKSAPASRFNSEIQSQQEAISFSVKVTEALRDKRKHHNHRQEGKVSLSQLKEVYRKAAKCFNESLRPNHSRGCWAMARVNMFIRLASIDNAKIAEALNSSLITSLDEMPCSVDFFKASADIEEYKLDYDFKDVDELYLEEYKSINYKWE
jgi:hypothetical protein|tara:strand:+ start:2657 stop:3178 length:522 start_codon:yes stop_codon:yes gene_type:complete